jgi:hypothetical protein
MFNRRDTLCSLTSRFRVQRAVAVALAAAIVLVSAAEAQSPTKPYSLADVLTLLQAGVAPNQVLPRVKTQCISFRLTEDNIGILRTEGADQSFLDALKGVCYVAPSTKIVVKHDTVAVRVTSHDTIRVLPSERADSVRRWESGKVVYDYDLRTYKGLPSFTARTTASGGGTTSSDSSGYHMDYSSFNSTGAIPVGAQLGSARIEATLLAEDIAGNSDIGIIFDADSTAASYYRFGFDGWGKFWVAGEGRMREQLPVSYTSSAFINTSTGATNKLAVEMRGTFAAFYINGNLVATHAFPGRLGGYAGLYASGAKIRATSIRAVELK